MRRRPSDAVDLQQLIDDIADALVQIDACEPPFKGFRRGVGPYGEPQLLRIVAEILDGHPSYRGRVRTKRCPDLLIEGAWAIEFKLARPFGDNGREAENWSVNLLHPYAGNASVLGDCFKLLELECVERKAVAVIGYEHTPPRIDLARLFASCELIAQQILGFRLSRPIEAMRKGLIHPVHQQLRVVAWEVLRK